MKKINHNGWTILLIGTDLIVYKNEDQRTYKIKEDNGSQPCDSWLLRRLRALDSQFCKGAVIRM